MRSCAHFDRRARSIFSADDYNPSSEDLEELDRVAREMAEDFVRAGRRTEAREGEAADDESDWDVEGEADLGENDDTDEVTALAETLGASGERHGTWNAAVNFVPRRLRQVVERDGFRLTVNTNWNVEERDAVDGADGPSTAGADGDVALLLEKRAAGKALSKREVSFATPESLCKHSYAFAPSLCARRHRRRPGWPHAWRGMGAGTRGRPRMRRCARSSSAARSGA